MSFPVESSIMLPLDVVVNLALRCLAEDKEDQPNMKELVAELDQMK
jgi:hypothetical protein